VSRFYEGDGDNPVSLMWNANIERICRGKRGQRILRELIDALLGLPERRLIADRMANEEGEVCAVACYATYKGKTLPPRATEFGTDQYATTDLGEAAGLGFMLAWELGALNDLVFHSLHLYNCSVILDVPILEERWFSQRPSYTRYADVPAGLRGYTPEERWQKIYEWAASRVRWQLPVPV
jgi:hypothetical protein